KGHLTLDFPNEEGSHAVQVLILPKTERTEGLAVHRDPLEAALLNPKSLEKENFNVRKTVIDTHEKSDFTITILTMRVPHELKAEFAFYVAQDPEKPIHIELD